MLLQVDVLGPVGEITHSQILHDVVLTISVCPAICERAFSCLSRVKTDWRLFLQVDGQAGFRSHNPRL